MDKTVSVVFRYDELTKAWEVFVHGVLTSIAARQAFYAVVLVCQELDQNFLIKTEVVRDVNRDDRVDTFEIINLKRKEK